MKAFMKIKALVVILALVVLFAGAFTILSTDTVEAARCCWVRVCTVNPPIYCWDECVPCPPGPPFP